MKSAIIQLGGKQFNVTEGTTFKIERQSDIHYSVLAYTDSDSTVFGTPTLKDITVSMNVIENKLDKKIRVVRFKAKSRYKKIKGHRQPVSLIKVTKISNNSDDKIISEAKVKPELKKKAVKATVAKKPPKTKGKVKS